MFLKQKLYRSETQVCIKEEHRRISEVKIKRKLLVLFLIDLTDVSVFMITVTMYLIMNIYIYMYVMLKHLEYFIIIRYLDYLGNGYNVN